MENTVMELEELYALGYVDELLEKVMEKCKIKLQNKTFAGMEKDDVTQEILLRVYRSLDKFDSSKAKLATFIDRIIDNTIKDQYKKTMRNKNLMVVNAVEVSHTGARYDDNESVISRDNSFGKYHKVDTGEFYKGCAVPVYHDYSYENFEVYTDLTCYANLTERELEVFKLRSVGYEFKEIAKIMNISKVRVYELWNNIKAKYKAL